MQALILAAGMGRRLGELTKGNTKCMVKVNGVTLIDRVLGQLSNLSLNRIIIVIGYEGRKLREYVGDKYMGKDIVYIENPIYYKTNNIYSLALAKEYLTKDDTILLESDLIFDSSILDLLIYDPHPNVALVAKYEAWMDGTMVRLDSDNNIINFIPKKAFRYEDIDLYYKTVNIYKFSKEFSQHQYIPFLNAYCEALGNNEYYEQVLRVITLLDNCNLKARPLEDQKWYEIDDIQDLDVAETLFADGERKLSKYQKRFGGYWRFPGLLDFCYLVNPYFPPKKMKEELRTNFDILLTEYPSGMEVNSLLAGKYFNIKKDYVCVGNGAAELIKSLMTKFDGNIGVIYPTFEEYPNRKDKQKIIPYIPNNKNYSYTCDDIINFFGNKDIDVLLLINPDNPSGNFICKQDLLLIASWSHKKGITLIIDESFVDFTLNGKESTLIKNDILESNRNLIVVKSISKSYGVPGLRLGIVATANKELIDWIKKDVSIWNINSFGEYYMQIFSKYELQYYNACELFKIERERFYKKLKEISFIRVIPSQANYFLCEIVAKYSSKELTEILLNKYDILIKDCGTKYAFKKGNYVRIAVRDTIDNNKLIDAMKKM